MIGLVCLVIGLTLGTAATFVNVMFNYDGDTSVPMVIWGFVIILMLTLLFLFISQLTTGGIV